MAIVKWYLKSNPSQVFSGSPIPLASAQAAVEQANRQYPDLFHWLEELK